MSRRTPDDGERVMLTYRCGGCDADARQWCISRSGRWASMLHSDRYYAAVRDGRLPLSMAHDLRLSPPSQLSGTTAPAETGAANDASTASPTSTNTPSALREKTK